MNIQKCLSPKRFVEISHQGAEDITFKKESQETWGELVNFDAMDAVFRACTELQAQDKSINRESVKALSGVGFTTQLAAGRYFQLI